MEKMWPWMDRVALEVRSSDLPGELGPPASLPADSEAADAATVAALLAEREGSADLSPQGRS